MKYTPNNIKSLEFQQVFVFGSNLRGANGAGAAALAQEKFGAISGNPSGLAGQSYAIPTKGFRIETLPLGEIHMHIFTFVKFARNNPQLEFLVTLIGCGLAGYTPSDIAPLWPNDLPPNVILPIEFHRK